MLFFSNAGPLFWLASGASGNIQLSNCRLFGLARGFEAQSGNYTNTKVEIDSCLIVSCSDLTGLNTGSPYYIAVTTYDTDGNESWYSSEAQATPVPDTLNVPVSYTTIQSALSGASEGDVVLVQPGTYTENIIWPETNGIKLISAGDSSNTIIDGGSTSSVIYMNPQSATIDTTTLIQGFKITNGGNEVWPTGGGMIIYNCGVKIIESSISNNVSQDKGG